MSEAGERASGVAQVVEHLSGSVRPRAQTLVLSPYPPKKDNKADQRKAHSAGGTLLEK
jgi:hypothetical protein